MGSRKYPLLNDEGWLRDRYIGEGLGTREIANMAGAKTANSARQALIRFGIEVRGIREGLVLGREEDGFDPDWSVVTGCLLGDGTLRSWSRSGGSAPHFRKRNKNRDHIEYVASLLFAGEAMSRVRERVEWQKCIGRHYTIYELKSLSHDSLKPWIARWYPDVWGRRKIVPADVMMDETVLLHWFLDDGSSSQRSGRHSRQIVITFSSESFVKEHQDRLAAIVNETFDLDAVVRPYNQGTGWRIHIPQSKADRFFEVIGPPPVPSLAYKWK